MENNERKSSGGCLKFLGVLFIIVLFIGGIVFVAKLLIDKSSDGKSNSDGNPVLLNRAATLNDFSLTESIEDSVINLKESYTLIPNIDIKDLEITFDYYNKNHELVVKKTKYIGSVSKSSEYTISIEHSLSELFSIETVSYYVTGGTVSYFA